MKKILALIMAIATLMSLCAFDLSAVTYDGIVESGLNYTECTDTISNPMIGYPSTPFVYLKLSGNTPRNDSGFVHYFLDMRMFSGGYTRIQVDEKGTPVLDKDGKYIYPKGNAPYKKVKLSEEQTADRVKCSFNSMWDWNGNQRNQGGSEDIPLNEDALNAIRGTLENLRKNGGTCLIRPEYAADADVNNEPYDFDMIITHAKQLSEIFTEYSDVVGGIEVGTIGPFGEMHSSPYCAQEYANKIIDTYVENTPESIKLMVRTPGYIIQYICDEYRNGTGNITLKDGTVQKVQQEGKYKWTNLIPFDNLKYVPQSKMKRLSLFNDGYMLTWNDTGTWPSRSEGVKWLSWASAYSYYGGEYGSGTRSEDVWLPKTALPEMYTTHVSYIHGNVYRSTMGSVKKWIAKFPSYTDAALFVTDLYEQSKKISKDDETAHVLDLSTITYSNKDDINNIECTVTFDAVGYDNFIFTDELSKAASKCDNSAYYGHSCYEFIRDHLGYRFVLRSSKLSNSVDRGGVLRLSGKIENTGFGNCLQDKVTQIVIVDSSDKEVACVTVNNADSLTWLSQETHEYNLECRLPADLPAGEYKAYMRICNVTQDGTPNTKTCVRFANNVEYYDTYIKANYLGKFNINTNVSPYGTDEFKQVITAFNDVSKDFWGYEFITDVCTIGLMSGTSQTTFDPNITTSRAMLVQVLYNNVGNPDVSKYTNPFKDVPEGKWYTNAIKWAYANEVVAGMTPNTYAPDNPVTREQFAAILYRFAEKIDSQDVSARGDVSAFTDYNKTQSYAQDALKWAVGKGYISGMSPTVVAPGGNATRAQMATIMTKYIDSKK